MRKLLLERPGRGWLSPLPSGIFGGSKFIAQRAISQPSGGRSWLPDSARGETAYLAGISIGGFHNSGVALYRGKARGRVEDYLQQ